jgi:hypothetical protein
MKLCHIRISSLLGSLLIITSSYADALPGDSASEASDAFRTIPEGMVHIINSLNTKIYFSLSYDGENWQKVILDPNRSEVFEFVNYIKISTKLKTETKTKTYKLMRSRRYQIVWNAQDGYYDVVKLSND